MRNIRGDLEKILRDYYALWDGFQPIVASSNCLVYSCSRSPILFCLGRNLYGGNHAPKNQAPGKLQHLLFDGFHWSHVERFLADFTGTDPSKKVVDEAFAATLGVPR